MPNFMPEYSMLYPATSSDSASPMSKGARPSSAMAAMMKMRAPSGDRTTYQIFCPWMMAFVPMEPAKMVGMSSMATMGISNETSTATWRKAPSRAYLLFDAQPAIIMESVPMAPAATRYSTPMLR